jgi:hypothetical protein
MENGGERGVGATDAPVVHLEFAACESHRKDDDGVRFCSHVGIDGAFLLAFTVVNAAGFLFLS